MTNAETNYHKGQKLRAKIEGQLVDVKYVKDYRGAAVVSYRGNEYLRQYSVLAKLNQPELAIAAPAEQPAVEAAPAHPNTYFDVNTRFGFIERMVDMVVRGQEKSLLVTGSGGLGKSFTVFNRLKLNELGEADYVKISGHMTPLALYQTLHAHNGMISVFDDCDSVLMNDTSSNLLKAALDSCGYRELSWSSQGGAGANIPSRFEFTGRVIFISNFSLVEVPQPLVSRAMYVDVTMTPQEKIDRIRAIAPAMCPELPDADRLECLDLLDRLKHQIADLNLRTMLKVSNIRRANPCHWKAMSEYMVTARLRRDSR